MSRFNQDDGNLRSSLTHAVRKTASGAAYGVIIMIIGLVFIAGPIFLGAAGILKGLSVLIPVGAGVALLVLGATLTAYARLYRKAAADLAYVRTGRGGKQVVIDGGMFVVPFLHDLQEVNLGTMRLPIERRGTDALITADKLRLDIAADFFVKIDKSADAIGKAAASLGSRCANPALVMELVEPKLTGALRNVAAIKTLEELNSKRDEFKDEVLKAVTSALAENGLTLETVTISKLDQTPITDMKPDQNVLDAEGVRNITRITSAMAQERAKIVAETSVLVKEQEVAARQKTLQLEAAQQQIEAETKAKQAMATAKSSAEAAKYSSEREKEAAEIKARTGNEIAQAQLAARQAEGLRKVEVDRTIALADADKKKQSDVAILEAQQAAEVKQREMEIAVANAEKAKAIAEAGRLAAEKDRQVAAQAVRLVEIEAVARQDASKAVIAKEAAAQQHSIEVRNAADNAAYQAEKEAEGQLAAAINHAKATTADAEAAKASALLRAEGAKAEGLVPVQVENERVGVEQKRVEVLRQELDAKAKNAAVSTEVQIALARIAADKDARIAFAQAYGQAMGSADIKIFGDPSTMGKMFGQFQNGLQTSTYLEGLKTGDGADVAPGLIEKLGSGLENSAAINGFMQNLDPATKASLLALLAGLVGRFTGGTPPPAPAAAPSA